MELLKTFCIIGDPIDHSLSPLIHNAGFQALNLNCSYIAFKVPHNELENSIESLRKINIAGFNVTIPHKVGVVKYLDEITPDAKLAGAVNTVVNKDGRLIGYNTDIYGFIYPLEQTFSSFENLNILILGSGGACRAALVGLSRKKDIKSVNIVNRDQNKLMNVIDLGKELGLPCIPVDHNSKSTIQNVALESDLIVNTTSIGLNNEKSIIEYDFIKKNSVVFDIVYKPIYTDLLMKAKKRGAKIIFGYEMLLHQAVKAFELFTHCNAPYEVMKKTLLGVFGEPR